MRIHCHPLKRASSLKGKFSDRLQSIDSESKFDISEPAPPGSRQSSDLLEAAWSSVVKQRKMASAFLGMNAYRTSVSWHQLQPGYKRNGYS